MGEKTANGGSTGTSAGERYSDNKLKHDIRTSNMNAAKKLADAIRTSLGPRGMDKMLVSGNNDVTITNDGATILNKMEVSHPAAKMLVELSKSQDIVAGDGTTSVTVLCGSLLNKCVSLLTRGVHPTVISDAMGLACDKACEILQEMSIPLDISDRPALIKAATTSLGSKVVAQYSNVLAPIAVDSVLKIMDPERPEMVDLKDIKILRKAGGTIDDTEMVPGLDPGLESRQQSRGRAHASVENAKVALDAVLHLPAQDGHGELRRREFRITQQMDRILKEESATTSSA